MRAPPATSAEKGAPESMSARLIALLPALLAVAAVSAGPPKGFVPPRERAPRGFEVTLCPPDGPKPYFILSGRVRGSDAKPLAGVNVYAYHTDEGGFYVRPGQEWRGHRYAGVLRTNARGEYRVRTIVPGSYPGGGSPHVHLEVWGKDVARLTYSLNVHESERDSIEAARLGMSFGPRALWGRHLALHLGADGMLRAQHDLWIDDMVPLPDSLLELNSRMP
jgi:hypothetical protein